MTKGDLDLFIFSNMVVVKNKKWWNGILIHMKCGLKSLVPKLTIISC